MANSQDEKQNPTLRTLSLHSGIILRSDNYDRLLRKSLGKSEFGKDDGSYLYLPIGELFAGRPEALGCPGGGNSVKRPPTIWLFY
jgi:hypothetical protein